MGGRRSKRRERGHVQETELDPDEIAVKQDRYKRCRTAHQGAGDRGELLWELMQKEYLKNSSTQNNGNKSGEEKYACTKDEGRGEDSEKIQGRTKDRGKIQQRFTDF